MPTIPTTQQVWRRSLMALADDIAPAQRITGLNGLSQRNLVGRKTTAGAPTTGLWAVDDEVVDSAGMRWRCTVAGTPGTWIAEPILPFDGLTSGEAIIQDRDAGVGTTLTANSGQMILSYFTARKTEAITQVRLWTGATAAAATPTICRIGVWSVTAAGVYTAEATTPNDTTLFATINTEYSKAFSVGFTKQAGVRYAVGVLIVTGAAMPSFMGAVPGANASQSIYALAPRLTASQSSLADLPALPSGLGNTSRRFQAVLLP